MNTAKQIVTIVIAAILLGMCLRWVDGEFTRDEDRYHVCARYDAGGSYGWCSGVLTAKDEAFANNLKGFREYFATNTGTSASNVCVVSIVCIGDKGE